MLAQEIEPPSIFRLFSVFSFVIGCCIGSFMNVVVWRLPRGESLTHPGSHCPKCGHEIRAWENIPILSWLFLRGRCSQCHLPISVKYPVGEGLTGLLFTFVWLRVFQRNLPLEVVPGYFFLSGALLAAALIDWEHRIIPDEITYSGLIMALLLVILLPESRLVLSMPSSHTGGSMLFNGLRDFFETHRLAVFSSRTLLAFIDCLLGTVAGAVLPSVYNHAMKLILKRNSIGGGDIKLLAMTGAFLGADATIYILLSAALFALFFFFLSLFLRRRIRRQVPLGPFLALAAYFWLTFGNYFYFLYMYIERRR